MFHNYIFKRRSIWKCLDGFKWCEKVRLVSQNSAYENWQFSVRQISLGHLEHHLHGSVFSGYYQCGVELVLLIWKLVPLTTLNFLKSFWLFSSKIRIEVGQNEKIYIFTFSAFWWWISRIRITSQNFLLRWRLTLVWPNPNFQCL